MTDHRKSFSLGFVMSNQTVTLGVRLDVLAVSRLLPFIVDDSVGF